MNVVCNSFTLLLCQIFLSGTTCLGLLKAVQQHSNTQHENVQLQMVEDLISTTNQNKNFILIINNLNYDCSTFMCEKYSVDNLRINLHNRGEVYYYKKKVDDLFLEQEELRIRNAGSSQSDVILLKLESFTNKQIKLLDEIRMYNMKSFLIVIVDKDDVFIDLKNHILTSVIYNIYVIKKSSKSEVYLVFELCAFCKNGKNEFKFYNSWKQGKGFHSSFALLSSYKGEFFGATLRVGMRIAPPYAFVIGTTTKGTAVYGGQEYWFLMLLAKAMNFKVMIVEPTDGTGCYYSTVRKSMTGYCEMLYVKEVDIAGFPVAVRYINYHFLDPTAAYGVIYNRLISASPKVNATFSISIKPSLLIAVGILYLVFTCLSLLIEGVQETNQINRYVLIPIQIFAVLCLESTRYKFLSISRQMVLGLWIVFCFFVISNMFGEITSAVTVKKPNTKYINSLEDMKEQNVSWIRSPFFTLDYLLKIKLPEQAKHRKIMTEKAGLEFILKNSTRYAYIFPREGIDFFIRRHFWDGKGENPFYFCPPFIGDSPLVITVMQ